jgi:pyridinium-3,5-bisthiocarboxylic acid mononucleotide nickel chelatase
VSRALFLESIAGVSGDMFAASFVDAGLVTAAELQSLPAVLGLEDVVVEVSHPLRATIRTTHIEVRWTSTAWQRAIVGGHVHSAHDTTGHSHGDSHGHSHGHSHGAGTAESGAPHWHTHYVDLDRFLAGSRLDEPVKTFARRVFHLIADAEAAAHGLPIEKVAFHEVGAVDSIVDVAMAAYCVAKVGATKTYATPLRLGRGTIQIEHGTFPVPPPATARLAIGMPVAAIPDAIVRPNVELSTPTGVAILRALGPVFVDSVPPGTMRAQGMGSGTMDLGAYPNVFRVVLLDETVSAPELVTHSLPYEADHVIEIVCNIDDETAERTAWLGERLLELGALDVWVTPVSGKKGRAAVILSVLAKPSDWAALADWLLRHSSTFGLRYRSWDRLKLARRFETRETDHGPLSFKIGFTTDGEVLKTKPEYREMSRIWETDPDFRR